VHAGFQLAHDRYSYLSCLSLAVLVGGGIVCLVRARDTGTLRPRLFATACSTVGALLATLAVLTWLQVQVWRDTESLWTHATFATPDCSICHDHYGALIINRAPTPPRPQMMALEHFHRALTLMPQRPQPYGGVGLALLQLGRPGEAEAALRRTLDGPRTELGVLNNLGVALNQQGRFTEALVYLRRLVELDRRNVVARANLGEALLGAGRVDEAIGELRRATDEQPFAPEPRIAIVLAYQKGGNSVEMRKHFTILRQLHPTTARDLAAKHRL
jgi:Flp pilus assembly protein TadD